MQTALPMKGLSLVKALDSCSRLLSFPLPLSHDCISRQRSHDVWERLFKCQHGCFLHCFIPKSTPERVAPLYFCSAQNVGRMWMLRSAGLHGRVIWGRAPSSFLLLRTASASLSRHSHSIFRVTTCTYLRVLTVRCSFFVSGYLQYYQKRENTYK